MLHIFSRVVGLSLGLYFVFYVPYFKLACEHVNPLLCLEEEERRRY